MPCPVQHDRNWPPGLPAARARLPATAFTPPAAGISGRANAGRRLGRSLRGRSFCFSPTDHLSTHRAGTWWVSGAEEWWWQDGRARRGAVRCGPEECRTVWGSAKRFLVVTGGPVWRVARAEPTWNDRSGTRNATARARHRAYWRRYVLGTVPSWERPVVADSGDLNQNC